MRVWNNNSAYSLNTISDPSCRSQACTDIWHGYTGCQKTVHQKQIRQVEGEFDMEVVHLIVQQLHAGVISFLALAPICLAPIWLILLNPVT